MEAKEFIDDYKYLGVTSLLEWTAKDSEVYNMISDCMEEYHQAKLKLLGIANVSKRTYNEDELRHIAVNYAINCLKGYEGSFTDWFNGLYKDWRKIANRKQ